MKEIGCIVIYALMNSVSDRDLLAHVKSVLQQRRQLYIPAYVTEGLNRVEARLSHELHAFFPPHLPATETAIYVHLSAA